MNEEIDDHDEIEGHQITLEELLSMLLNELDKHGLYPMNEDMGVLHLQIKSEQVVDDVVAVSPFDVQGEGWGGYAIQVILQVIEDLVVVELQIEQTLHLDVLGQAVRWSGAPRHGGSSDLWQCFP